jgi:hypothetical protein
MGDAFRSEHPLLPLFENQLTTGELFVNPGINVKQFERLLAAEGGGISRGAADGDAVGIE